MSTPILTDSPANSSVDSGERPYGDSLSLSGKVIVVTGGARGIGQELTRGIAKLGGHVAVLDRAKQASFDLSELGRAYDIQARYFETDVTDKDSLEDAFTNVIEAYGQIDGCVTAAGIMFVEDFLKHGWDDAVNTQMVNVIGTFMTVQLTARQLKAQGTGGSIVMVSSVASHQSTPALPISAYAASKGAIQALRHALAVELGPLDIRVNTISPGYIRTDMTEKAAAHNSQLITRFGREPPLGRMGETNDLTGIVTFLLSELSSYITGTDILVTGGLHAGRYT